MCPDCGNLAVICGTPEGATGEGFYPQRRYCYVTATRDVVIRRLQKMHAKAVPDRDGFGPLDGLALSASPWDLKPEDDFLNTSPDDA